MMEQGSLPAIQRQSAPTHPKCAHPLQVIPSRGCSGPNSWSRSLVTSLVSRTQSPVVRQLGGHPQPGEGLKSGGGACTHPSPGNDSDQAGGGLTVTTLSIPTRPLSVTLDSMILGGGGRGQNGKVTCLGSHSQGEVELVCELGSR